MDCFSKARLGSQTVHSLAQPQRHGTSSNSLDRDSTGTSTRTIDEGVNRADVGRFLGVGDAGSLKLHGASALSIKEIFDRMKGWRGKGARVPE